MKKTKKQFRKVNKKHESGRSMIEMVGVLAVMGLITAGAFVLISSAMSSQRISRVDDEVSALVQGVRLLYNANNNFTGLSDDALQVLAFSTVKNPFGGGYHLRTSDNSDVIQKNARFTIVIDGLGAANAKALAGRVWPSGGVASCGTFTSDEFTATAAQSATQNSPAVAAGACKDDSNAVGIVYGKDDGIAL